MYTQSFHGETIYHIVLKAHPGAQVKSAQWGTSLVFSHITALKALFSEMGIESIDQLLQ